MKTGKYDQLCRECYVKKDEGKKGSGRKPPTYTVAQVKALMSWVLEE